MLNCIETQGVYMISGWLMRTGECVLSERKVRKLKNNLCYFKSFCMGGR